MADGRRLPELNWRQWWQRRPVTVLAKMAEQWGKESGMWRRWLSSDCCFSKGNVGFLFFFSFLFFSLKKINWSPEFWALHLGPIPFKIMYGVSQIKKKGHANLCVQHVFGRICVRHRFLLYFHVSVLHSSTFTKNKISKLRIFLYHCWLAPNTHIVNEYIILDWLR